MTTKETRSPPSRKKRPRPAVIADIVVGMLISAVAFVFLLALVTYADQFVNPVFGVTLKILAVLSWFGGTAVFILVETRGRYAFYWPLIGIVAMFSFYYLVLFVASRVAA